ncbi:MAG: ABC-F family ATP-binding cassette domain-containing protein [Spirochaetales bacterium]|nr:ABC-F family ATP-binding cassette domain-containing protein [Spirochaetales bacterium]
MNAFSSTETDHGVNLLSVKNIAKTHGEKRLFTDITFGINKGEKLALIGANGTGKSTLMKIICGEMECDEGEVYRNNSLHLAYLPQNPVIDPGQTVLEHILSGDSLLIKTVRSYESCLSRLHSADPGDQEKLQHELAALSRRMDEVGGWTMEHKITSVLEQLGINGLDAAMGTLSGGMKKKVELAKTLAGMNNCIVLDEPTNHLDLETIEWLQDYLVATDAAVILITHDRYFLDGVCSKILELEDGGLTGYQGNYSLYMELKAKRLEEQATRQVRIGSVLRQELEWLKRSPRARGTKDKKRVERVYDLMDSTDSQRASAMEFSVTNRRLGKRILEIKNISKAFGPVRLIDGFSYSVKKGIRIGIVGPNGSGKTTFLKMLMGQQPPDTGRIDIGVNTRFGYFDQLSESMNGEQTVMGYLKEYADEIKRENGETANIRSLLEEFQFPVYQHHSKLKFLSGGELRRLYLLKILLPAPNFLLFDEPTNDLDIQTLSLLEQFLDKFDGCVMTVSHDRYFLDRTADFLLIFDGEGGVQGYPGSYSEYARYRKEQQKIEAAETQKPDSRVRHNTDQKKLSFKEQKEFEALLPAIENLEEQKAGLEAFFLDPVPAVLAEKQELYTRVCREIADKTARWEELADRAG